MSDQRDEYLQMIEDCEKRERALSSWDADFLESIKARLIDRKPLTEKQAECLSEIWERATERG